VLSFWIALAVAAIGSVARAASDGIIRLLWPRLDARRSVDRAVDREAGRVGLR